MTYAILIPAFNAAQTIADVLNRIHAVLPSAPIIVVNDGSTDGTARIAAEAGAQVISHEHNQGKGAALRSGFVAALRLPVDAVIQLDSDGQHLPESLPDFIATFERGGVDLVIGQRSFDSGSMPFPRRLSNTMTSWVISRLCRTSIPDSQSGFRLIRRLLAEKIQPRSNAFDFESEYLLLATNAGYQIGSVPIPTVYGIQGSTIQPWRDTLRFIKLIGLFWNNRSNKRMLHLNGHA